MFYHDFQIVLQEVPGEISLCFSISGCPLRCEGCHSPYLWKANSGNLLSLEVFENKLIKYEGFASCVLFMGGEWHESELIKFLKIANNKNYKTCLYSGENEMPQDILDQLTYVKTGSWKAALGGLNNPNTNQKFIDLKTNTILNHLFIKN